MMKKRMTGAEVTMQTRVPHHVAAWIATMAEVDGDSVAGWLRRHLIGACGAEIVRAWIFHEDRSDPAVILNQGLLHHYLLQRVRESLGGEIVFRLFHGAGKLEGVRVSDAHWRESLGFRDPGHHRFILEASPHPWRIGTTYHDAANDMVLVGLAPDLHDTPAIAPSTHEEYQTYLEQEVLRLLRSVAQTRSPHVSPETAADIEVLLRIFDAHMARELPAERSPHTVGQPRPGSALTRAQAQEILTRMFEALREFRNL